MSLDAQPYIAQVVIPTIRRALGDEAKNRANFTSTSSK